MKKSDTRRGPHRATVLLVGGMVGALLIGTAGGAVGASLITSKQIKNGTIQAADIKNNTITSKKIRNGSVSGKDVKNRSLTASDITKSSLTGALVKDGSLTGADVEDASLTAADIALEARGVWAVVNADGSLARGTAGVSSQNTSTGVYRLTFPIGVDQCAFSATIGNASSGVPGAGGITATPTAGIVEGVYVTTTNPAGASSNRAFHLVISC